MKDQEQDKLTLVLSKGLSREKLKRFIFSIDQIYFKEGFFFNKDKIQKLNSLQWSIKLENTTGYRSNRIFVKILQVEAKVG